MCEGQRRKKKFIRFFKKQGFLPRFVQRDPSVERWDYWTVILIFISLLFFTAWAWTDVCDVEQLNSELNKISGLLRWRQTWKRMIFSHACLNWSLGTRQSKCSDWVTQSTDSQSMQTHTHAHRHWHWCARYSLHSKNLWRQYFDKGLVLFRSSTVERMSSLILVQTWCKEKNIKDENFTQHWGWLFALI